MRKERFWGLHFDFHAGNDVEIGGNTNAEDIERYILDADPDFIQCDCKGHPGNACYPTKIGKSADKLVADNLKVWVETAHKHGVPIYMHYSGIIDEAYCRSHPEFEALNVEGKGRERHSKVSLFSPYLTDYMIPQIKELITEYKVDGIWVDGDCWAVQEDYSDCAKRVIGDVSQEENRALMRDKFFEYVRTYVDEIHAFNPDFMITSNWAYTSRMPELPTDRGINIDYISGDLAPNNSINEGRHESRFIALRGLPWDIMSWGFNFEDMSDKSDIQLMQEAAIVLSQGGGFQIYTAQAKDGSARKYSGNRFSSVAKFVRARKFLFNKKPFATFGILFDKDHYYSNANCFNAEGCINAIRGALYSFLDVGYTANILLTSQRDEYKNHDVLVVAETDSMSDESIENLITYATNGGKILVIGKNVCKKFLDKRTISYGEENKKTHERICVSYGEKCNRAIYLCVEDKATLIHSCYTDGECLVLQDGEGKLCYDKVPYTCFAPAYKTEKVGKGSVTYIPFDFGSGYFNLANLTKKAFVKEVLSSITEKSVDVNNNNIDVSTQRDENKVYVNLVNVSQGRQSLTYTSYDEIYPALNVTVKINFPTKQVSLPFGENYTVDYKADCAIVKIEKIDIHTVIVCE